MRGGLIRLRSTRQHNDPIEVRDQRFRNKPVVNARRIKASSEEGDLGEHAVLLMALLSRNRDSILAAHASEM